MINQPRIIFLALSLVILSCRSSTVIFSNPGGAKVYVNDEYKGTTPYFHQDRRVAGTSFRLKLEKEGYNDYSTRIKKFEKPAAPLAAAVFFTAPPTGIPLGVAGLLWGAKYKRSRIYSLDDVDANEKFILPLSFNWSSELEMKGRINNFYLNPQNHISLFSGHSVYTLDDNFVLTDETSLEYDLHLRGMTHVLDVLNHSDGSIAVHKRSPVAIFGLIDRDEKIFFESLDKFGTSLSYKEILVAENVEYLVSPNKKFFGAYSDDKLSIFDLSLNLVTEQVISESQFGFTITNEGDVFGLRIDDNLLSLEKYEKDNILSQQLSVPVGYSARSFVINTNIQTNSLIVSSTIGLMEDKKKGFNISFGPAMEGVEFKTVGSYFHYINLQTLLEEKSDMILFSNEILEEAKTLGTKFQDEGLIYMVNRGVLFNGDEIIQQLEQSWKKIVTTTRSNGSSTTDVYFNDGNLLVVKPGAQGAKEKLIKKASIVPERVKNQGSFSSFIHDGNVYFLYNNVASTAKRKDLVLTILDSDLNNLYDNIYPTYEDQKAYVATNSFEGFSPLIKDNKLIFLATYNKKCKLLTLDLY